MSTNKPSAISGVSPGEERELVVRYPSIACTGLGRLLGGLYESIPVPSWLKLSHLLFVLPTAPLAALMYLGLKLVGPKYVLTTQSVQKRSSLGTRLIGQAPLSEIDSIEIYQTGGQVFYRAADLHLQNAAGKTLLRIESLPHADVFRQNILETRDARAQTEASLATIQARQPA